MRLARAVGERVLRGLENPVRGLDAGHLEDAARRSSSCRNDEEVLARCLEAIADGEDYTQALAVKIGCIGERNDNSSGIRASGLIENRLQLVHVGQINLARTVDDWD